jgi:hypothetical protein
MISPHYFEIGCSCCCCRRRCLLLATTSRWCICCVGWKKLAAKAARKIAKVFGLEDLDFDHSEEVISKDRNSKKTESRKGNRVISALFCYSASYFRGLPHEPKVHSDDWADQSNSGVTADDQKRTNH